MSQLAPYAGFEPINSEPEPPPPTTEDLLAERAAERLDQLEAENADLQLRLKALTSALGVAAKVLQPYWAPAKLARQR